jgi:hypothetical protein
MEISCVDNNPLVAIAQDTSYTKIVGCYFLRLSFSQILDCFLGILWRYLDRSDPVKRIVHFDRQTGNILKSIVLGTVGEREFCLNGISIFTSDFRLINSETGMTIRQFERL